MPSKSAAQLNSEIAVVQMIGRRVKSGWHGLADGKIIQWEPFGAGMTDVLVHDTATGRESWYASHGLTPIDGYGPLPSREEVRKIRRHEMEASLERIREQHARDLHRPWPGAEFGKAIIGRAIDGALASVRGSEARPADPLRPPRSRRSASKRQTSSSTAASSKLAPAAAAKKFTTLVNNEAAGRSRYVGTFDDQAAAQAYADAEAGRSRKFVTLEVWTGTPDHPGKPVGNVVRGKH